MSSTAHCAEMTKRLYYESAIMTSADSCCCCCLRHCSFRRVSASLAAAAHSSCRRRPDRPTDRILAAHCQSARVYHSTPVRPLIAASSAADAAAVASGTTRPAPSISSVLPSASPPYLPSLAPPSPRPHTVLSILLRLLSVVSFYD